MLRPEIARRLPLLRCPTCHGDLGSNGPAVTCASCGTYTDDESGLLRLKPRQSSEVKSRIESFWSDTYQQWYGENDADLDSPQLNASLDHLEDLFERRRHLAMVEMPLDRIAGADVLEIGCGAGGQSALFRRRGAHVTSVDLTPARALSTDRKHQLLRHIETGSGLAIEADAEELPFKDNSFDIVYSNGVLHHSENTKRCVDQAFRVLKPGGSAVMMLYARHSAYYWLHLLPRAVLSGRIFREAEANWLGWFTEGRPKYQSERNPLTRVYSRRQIADLFDSFTELRVRKNGFMFWQFPLIGRLRDPALEALGYELHQGGILVYGSPFVPETHLELLLSPFVGWCLNITARKPGASNAVLEPAG